MATTQLFQICRFFPVLLLTLLVACTEPRVAPEDLPPPLLLISIDGFRHDYFERTDLPNLQRLIDSGLKADSLVHVFPTKTFATHYSLVTGLYAENTGVVANSMWDPRRRDSFSLRNREAVMDGFWYDGEPIWVTAEKQGLRAATYFWPGSEARIAGVRPTWWTPYDGSVSHRERVEHVLDWLDLPPGQAPSFLTLYFSRVDADGHRHGPDAPELEAAMRDVDRHLGLLLDGLEARDLLGRMHLLVVSDHGMSSIDRERYIMLEDYLDLSRVRVSDWGPAAQIWAQNMNADDIVGALTDAHPHLRVWARDDIPERYGFRHHARIADVLAEADAGWMISNRPYLAAQTRFPARGMHGWDPWHVEMGGILIAHGPAFAAGTRMPRVEAVHLYPLMTALLNLEPAAHDGDLAAFAGHADLAELTGRAPPPSPSVIYGDRAPDESRVWSVAEILSDLDRHRGARLTVTGEVTQVCTNRGCWAVLAEGEYNLRIMIRDHAFGLPADFRTRAVVEGDLEMVAISPGHARHLVEDDGADPAVLDKASEPRLMTRSVKLLP